MFKNFVDKIDIICKNNTDTTIIYEKVKKILLEYKPEELNEIIEEELDINYDNIKKYEMKMKNNVYYKYILYNSSIFDIIHIKWEKGCESKIHDHPTMGCILYVINDGEIMEHNYFKNYDGKLLRNKTKILKYGKIGYKIGKKTLHKIKANSYTETLHIYIPGNYKPTYYN
jgi:predicted metal-dependent enzyme (double-stranded beta helix superfamily)